VYEIVYMSHIFSVAISHQHAFGKRVRALRTSLGMTQEDLAERCGLFRTYLSRIETGEANPTLTMIHALAVSLEVPVTDMFIDSDIPVASVKKPRASRGRVVK